MINQNSPHNRQKSQLISENITNNSDLEKDRFQYKYYLAYMYKYRHKTVDLAYLKIFHDLFKFILDKEISHLKRLKYWFMAAPCYHEVGNWLIIKESQKLRSSISSYNLKAFGVCPLHQPTTTLTVNFAFRRFSAPCGLRNPNVQIYLAMRMKTHLNNALYLIESML